MSGNVPLLDGDASERHSTRTNNGNASHRYSRLSNEPISPTAADPMWARRMGATASSCASSVISPIANGDRSISSPERAHTFSPLHSAYKDESFFNLSLEGGFRRHFLHKNAHESGIRFEDRPACWSEPLSQSRFEWTDAAPFISFFGGLTQSESIVGTGNSKFATSVALFKAMVCTGITFTPAATAKCGWVFAIVAFPCLAVLCVLGVQLLIHCMKLYTSHRSFAELAHDAYGPHGRTVVNLSIVLTQSAFCAVYLLFAADSVPLLCGIARTSPYFHAAQLATLLGEIALFVPLSWLREIGALNVVNELGSAGILFGIVSMLGMFSKLLYDNGVHPDVEKFDSASWPIFVGVAGYTFEGIAAILPIYQALEVDSKHQWPFVFIGVIFFVTCMLTSVGVLGYMALGPNVCTVVLESLPNSWLKTVMQGVYVFAIICSFPLQFFPVPKIVEATLVPTKFLTDQNSRILRGGFVCALAAIAYGCRRNLGEMVEVVGSLLAVPLMLVMPVCIHLSLRNDSSCGVRVLDVCLLLVGISLTATCTVVSLTD